MNQEANLNQQIADYIYRAFCECCLNDSHPFQKAWYAYEEKFGEIEINSLADILVLEAMRFAVDYALNERDEILADISDGW